MPEIITILCCLSLFKVTNYNLEKKDMSEKIQNVTSFKSLKSDNKEKITEK